MIVENIEEYIDVVANEYTKSNVGHSLYVFAIYCEQHGLIPSEIDLHEYKKYVAYLKNQKSSQPEIASRTYDAQKYLEWLGEQKNIHNPTYKHNRDASNDDTLATQALDSQKINPTRTKLEEKYPEEIQFLSLDEYHALLDNTDDFRMEIIYVLLFETGARASELSELDLEYLYLDERRIRMPTKKNPNTDRRNVYVSNSTSLKNTEMD